MDREEYRSFYKQSNTVPFKLRIIRWYIKLLSFISTEKAVSFLVDLFVSPRVDKEKMISRYEEMDIFSNGNTQYLDFNGESIFTYTEGKPEVLLVMGWESSAHRFITVMEKLRKEKLGFLYFDLPGHGKSEGKTNDAVKTANLIEKLLVEFSSIHSIIAHSFGGGASYLALEHGSEVKDQVNTLITIGSPTHYVSVVTSFFVFLDVPEKLEDRFIQGLSDHIGRDFTAYDWNEMEMDYNLKVICFHDRDDKTIPVYDAKRVADRHQIKLTDGLGHRKILHKDEIISEMISVIKNNK